MKLKQRETLYTLPVLLLVLAIGLPCWAEICKGGYNTVDGEAGDVGSDDDLDIMGANWSGPYQPIGLWLNRMSDRNAAKDR